jgi:hypothetical protein
VPRELVCITERATFGFHQATIAFLAPAPEATEEMYQSYPKVVRDWIDANGPLKEDVIYMHAFDLHGYYPMCTYEGLSWIPFSAE